MGWPRSGELNDLRRSFATEMAIKGVPMLFLMHLMGHASTAMLEKIYARVGRGQHMHDAIALLSPLGALVEQAESTGTNTGQTPRDSRTTRTVDAAKVTS